MCNCIPVVLYDDFPLGCCPLCPMLESFLKLVPTSLIPVLWQWLKNVLHSEGQSKRGSLWEDISDTGIIVETSVHKSQKPGSEPASHCWDLCWGCSCLPCNLNTIGEQGVVAMWCTNFRKGRKQGRHCWGCGSFVQVCPSDSSEVHLTGCLTSTSSWTKHRLKGKDHVNKLPFQQKHSLLLAASATMVSESNNIFWETEVTVFDQESLFVCS